VCPHCPFWVGRDRWEGSPPKGGLKVGAARYSRDEWSKLREVASDPERLEQSYEAWLAMAEEQLQKLRKTGIEVERVDVRADDIVEWCTLKGRPVDGSSRAAFASELLGARHERSK